jgi:hypothetical protein
MDRSAKKVLRYMLHVNPADTGHCLFHHFYDDCVQATGLSEHQVSTCIRTLEKNGFISYVTDQHGHTVGFESESKAYHRRHYEWVPVRDLLIKSVFLPLLVSFLTAFATTLWLPKLLNWLSSLQ